MSVILDGRDISDLRVVDLRLELEKRGLDKSGNKQILLERLQKAIEEEPLDTELQTKKESDKDNTSCTHNGSTDDAAKMNNSKSSDIADGSKTSDSAEVAQVDLTNDEMEPKTTDLDKKNTSSENSAEERDGCGNNGTSDVNAELMDKAELTLHDQGGDLDISKQEKDSSLVSDVVVNESKDSDVPAAEQKPDNKVEISAEKGEGDKKSPAAATTKDKSSKDAQLGGDKEKVKKDGVKSEAAEQQPPADAKDKTTKAIEKPSNAAAAPSSTPSKIKDRLVNDQNRNLWITNISQTTRATELKQALSEHGKVVGAKVVINARHPAACCYGYVRMETVADADNCIAKLNNTELNGQIIRIEKVRPDHLNPNSKSKTDSKDKTALKPPIKAPTPTKSVAEENAKKDRKPVEAPKEERKEKPNNNNSTTAATNSSGKTEEKKPAERPSRDKNIERDRRGDKRPADRVKSRSRDRISGDGNQRSVSRGRNERTDRTAATKPVPIVRKERDMLTFDKIKTERERERLRERERIMRNRRREESARMKEIERNQRSEAMRLEREREKLKAERDRLERERAEFLELERERQKMEREKIELERIELERAKLRMQEEERRAVKRPAPTNFRERERSYEERKRSVPDRHFEEAPPPPRFDGPSSIKNREPSPPPLKKFTSTSSSTKDYGKGRINYDKRDTYPPKRDYDERSHTTAAMPRGGTGGGGGGGGGGPPVAKYESTSSSSYSRDRDMRSGNDPRVRSSGTGGITSVSSTSKYSSDNKVRYSERERERSPHFSSRSIRGGGGGGGGEDRDRRTAPDSNKQSDIRSSRGGGGEHRYPEPKGKVDSVRYDRTSSSGGASWNQPKTFTATNSSSSKPWSNSKDTWRSDPPSSTGDRWNNNAPRGTPSMSSGFSSNPSINMGPTCPPPPDQYEESLYADDDF